MRVTRGFQLRYVKGVESTPAAARIQYMPMTHCRANVGRRSAVVGTLRPRSCRACAERGAWVPVSAWRGADPCTPVLTSSQRNLSQREVPEAREPRTTQKFASRPTTRPPSCAPPQSRALATQNAVLQIHCPLGASLVRASEHQDRSPNSVQADHPASSMETRIGTEARIRFPHLCS